jgi:cytochrome c55X
MPDKFLIQINTSGLQLPHVLCMSLFHRALWLVAALVCVTSVVAGQPVGATRQKELVRLVRQDCGSCHGLTLKGGLGPPLTAQALKEKPVDSLKATILGGRPGTPMPPWRAFMNEAEADWIVNELLKGFPDER